MAAGTERNGSRLGWVTPAKVALLGSFLVALLMLLPIKIGPGDHEKKSCGNALEMNLHRWVVAGDRYYWEMAFRTCSSKRIDRIGQAVGVTSLTVLAVTLMAVRARRRSDDSDWAAPRNG